METIVQTTFEMSAYQKALLKKAIAEAATTEYIPNDKFLEEDAESKLFATEVPPVNADWYASFVNRIGKSKLPSISSVLTTEQEVALFFQFNFAKKELISFVSKYNAMDTGEDTIRSILKWNKKVIDFRAQIVNHNLALVLSLVKKFKGSNLDFDEMLSEGNTILLNAINKYDAGRGLKFSTYVTYSVTRAFGKVSQKKDKGNKFFPVSLDLELQKSDQVDKKHEEQVNDGVLTLREILGSNSANLTEEEMEVITSRYPRDASTEFSKPTLETLGLKFKKNKSNMSRIEKKAISKLALAFQKALD